MLHRIAPFVASQITMPVFHAPCTEPVDPLALFVMFCTAGPVISADGSRSLADKKVMQRSDSWVHIPISAEFADGISTDPDKLASLRAQLCEANGHDCGWSVVTDSSELNQAVVLRQADGSARYLIFNTHVRVSRKSRSRLVPDASKLAWYAAATASAGLLPGQAYLSYHISPSAVPQSKTRQSPARRPFFFRWSLDDQYFSRLFTVRGSVPSGRHRPGDWSDAAAHASFALLSGGALSAVGGHTADPVAADLTSSPGSPAPAPAASAAGSDDDASLQGSSLSVGSCGSIEPWGCFGLPPSSPMGSTGGQSPFDVPDCASPASSIGGRKRARCDSDCSALTSFALSPAKRAQ